MEEGASISRPPLLKGVSNYAFWKARMKAFIKSLDEECWDAVENGWTPPTVTEQNEIKRKPVIRWTTEEKRLSSANNRALNAIHSAMSSDQFMLISATDQAKGAWDALETHFEGTGSVKVSKIQMLMSQYESLRMEEWETVSEFSARVKSLANNAFNLGEPFDEEKMVRKVLRSLPPKFKMQAIAIKQSTDLKTLSLDALMGNLQTFEMELEEEDKHTKKNKGVAFGVTTQNTGSDSESDEAMALLTKKFTKFLKKTRGRGNTRGSNTRSEGSGNNQKAKGAGNNYKQKGIQCYECGGYGHVQADCANNKGKKSFTLTWSDTDDSDKDEQEEQQTSNFVAFHGNIYHPDDTEEQANFEKFFKCADQEEPELQEATSQENDLQSEDEDDLAKAYEELYTSWCKVSKLNRSLLKDAKIREAENLNLKLSIKTLENVISIKDSSEKSLQKELEHLRKQVRMLNTGTDKLDEILRTNGQSSTKVGLGYVEGTSNQSKTTWLRKKTKQVRTYTNHFLNQRCFRCNEQGHSWRWCRILELKLKKMWRPKIVCLDHMQTDQLADIFTKALDGTRFENHRHKLGLCQSP